MEYGFVKDCIEIGFWDVNSLLIQIHSNVYILVVKGKILNKPRPTPT